MYTIGKLRLFAGVVLLLLTSCMPQQSAALPSCPVPTPSLHVHGIPTDVCGPNFDFNEFGHMAWQTFKTLVWPASGRGTADTGREITDMKGPRVFETYKGDWETFLADKVEPLPWHRYPSKVPEALCANADAMRPPLDKDSLVLAALHKFGNIDQRDEFENDIFHVLVAQNRTVVRYLTGFGEKAFNTIRNNKLYEPVGIPLSYNAPQVGKTKTEPGTLIVKSAWIDMKDIDAADARTFHVRSAWVQRPSAHPKERICDNVTVGLVGLHIGHKTEKSPQWIWASFEHVKNVPPRGYRGSPYTFNSGKGPDMDTRAPLEARLPIDPFVVPAPYNVERLKEIPEKVIDVNRSWQEMLSRKKSVWQNYQLVAIQWAGLRGLEDHTGSGVQIGDLYSAQPEPPCLTGDANLANSVLETFLQPYTKCSKELTCMTCHNKARSYDFIWSIPLAHRQPDGAPSQTRRDGLSTLSAILKSSDRK